MRDNEYNQSDVAYGSIPNERDYKGMPKSEQFPGIKNKMPQGNNFVSSKSIVNRKNNRYSENR